MKLSVTGLNHTTAPVEVRERLAFKPGVLEQALTQLRATPGVMESVILSTCNRVEIAVTAEDAFDAHQGVEDFLALTHQVDPAWLRQYLYHYEGEDAIHHLFRVAASLDSMVVGEPQILGQLKDAYEAAKTHGAVNGFLETVVTRAFSVAKRVRTETEIGASAVSVSYAAVEMARQIFGSLKGRKVMLVGAGKMSELAARHLERAGVGEILVANRSPDRAQAMAALFRGRVVDYTGFLSSLPEIDVLIASSAAPHFILGKDDMRRVIGARKNRPMFLIDIAVPRNIEPSVNDLDNVFLYDIDDLQKVVESNKLGRAKEADEAERIVAGEVSRMVDRLRAREVSPMIVGLQQYLESIRTAEIDRVRGKLGALTPQQQEAIDALTKGIVNKIAHAPISELRRSAGEPQGHHFMDVFKRIFRLGE